jgi:hypothetical protein
MARLSKARRSKLPASDFAGPGRSYPEDTPARARAAIGFAAMHHPGNHALLARVRGMAKAKYGIGKKRG